jgi:acyl carrier protein
MEEKVLEIINYIRTSKGLSVLPFLYPENNLRDDFGFTSLDLAELTVRIEDEFDIDVFENGIINTIGDIFQELS